MVWCGVAFWLNCAGGRKASQRNVVERVCLHETREDGCTECGGGVHLLFFGWTISWRRCNRTDLRAVVHNALTHAVELIGCAQWSD